MISKRNRGNTNANIPPHADHKAGGGSTSELCKGGQAPRWTMLALEAEAENQVGGELYILARLFYFDGKRGFYRSCRMMISGHPLRLLVSMDR